MTTSSNPKTILVSVAWPYANGEPHVGHVAGVNIPADVFARFHRLIGNRVAMVSGSDMHGTPTMLRALDEGTTPKEVAERYHKVWVECLEKLGIAYDLYTRTDTPNHAEVTQEILLGLWRNGQRPDGDNDHVEEREEELPFSASEGIFLPDRMVEGTCPECGYEEARGDQCDGCGKTLDPKDLINIRSKRDGSTPVFRKTKHLFLKLPHFKKKLIEWLAEDDKREQWKPNVFNQTSVVADTIPDRAITRDLTWGVEVPPEMGLEGYEEKRIYVWFEAVLGYLSATKEWAQLQGKPDLWEDFWLKGNGAESYYFMGKDNIPFHSVILPAILMGYNKDKEEGKKRNLPTEVVANEFLNIGRKLSKSGGNAVWLRDYLANYDPEPLRYYLTSVMPETSDSEFTWEGFLAANNNELVATFGNLVNRTLTLVEREFKNCVPKVINLDHQFAQQDPEGYELLLNTNTGCLVGVREAISNKRFKDGLKVAMGLARAANRYLDQRAPWKQVREDEEGAAITLSVALLTIATLKTAFYPYLPRTAERLHKMLGLEGTVLECGWEVGTLQELNKKPNHPLGKAEILFRKLDEEIVARENAKLSDGNV